MPEVPAAVVTSAWTGPAGCAGVTAVREVVLVTVTSVAGAPSKATVVPAVKLVPVRCTVWSPAVGPEVGVRPVSVGAASTGGVVTGSAAGVAQVLAASDTEPSGTSTATRPARTFACRSRSTCRPVAVAEVVVTACGEATVTSTFAPTRPGTVTATVALAPTVASSVVRPTVRFRVRADAVGVAPASQVALLVTAPAVSTFVPNSETCAPATREEAVVASYLRVEVAATSPVETSASRATSAARPTSDVRDPVADGASTRGVDAEAVSPASTVPRAGDTRAPAPSWTFTARAALLPDGAACAPPGMKAAIAAQVPATSPRTPMRRSAPADAVVRVCRS